MSYLEVYLIATRSLMFEHFSGGVNSIASSASSAFLAQKLKYQYFQATDLDISNDLKTKYVDFANSQMEYILGSTGRR